MKMGVRGESRMRWKYTKGYVLLGGRYTVTKFKKLRMGFNK